ncbi:Pycsar system effector family protein [Rasiella sp. SM2506]|uniref:Pycsar system effector family protein n=1 Tax=Rasiella sp. SM2506 TaxID=3423914 RepID=UPI003D7BDBC5
MIKDHDHSKFLIQRFDQYTEGANSKGNFLLAFNTFLCGFLLSSFNSVVSFGSKDFNSTVEVFLGVIVILGVISMFFTLRAVYPYLHTGNSSEKRYHSLVFFKSISEISTEDAFVKEYKEQKEKKVGKDLAKQIYAVSKGLTRKYNRIKWAIWFIYPQLFFLIVILILKIV